MWNVDGEVEKTEEKEREALGKGEHWAPSQP